MNSGEPGSAGKANGGIPELVETLLETERRIEELTEGEVDTVAGPDGRTIVLQRAQGELRHRGAARQNAILNALHAHIALLDAQGLIVSVNEAWREYAGAKVIQSPGHAVGLNYLEICAGAQGEDGSEARQIAEGIRLVLEGNLCFSIEYAFDLPEKPRWFLVTVTPIADARPGGAVVMQSEITDQKRTSEALRTSLGEFRTLAESMPQIVWIARPDGGNVYFNQRWMDYTGLTREESLGTGWNKAFHPEDQKRAWEAWKRAKSDISVYSVECRLRGADGADRWWLVRGVPLQNAAGGIERWFGTCTDIHDLKLAELENTRARQALQRQQTELRVLFDMMPAMVWFKDTENRVLRVNQRAAQNSGKSVGEIEGKSCYETYPEEAVKYFADDLEVMNPGAPKLGIVETIRGREGEEIWVQTDKVPVFDPAGKVIGVVVMAQNISERKRTETALREAEAKYRSIFENSTEGIFQNTPDGRFVSGNPALARILGYASPEELIRERADIDRRSLAEPARREKFNRLLEEQGFVNGFEHEVQRKNGAKIWISENARIVRDTAGRAVFYEGSMQDITERKKSEEQSRQTQKMEAIGTLAGGIAHDFNNILAAINGYTELARLIPAGDPKVPEYLSFVLQASSRAADLVRQILTFSRQQPLERRSIQLQPIVAESLKLLRATLPSTIEFETSIAADAPAIFADPTQIHQILMNLGTNSWHAMKDQPGRLQVKLERCVVDAGHAATQPRLRPGLYARLSVSDTGGGMEPATLRRIFEPFFTTKPPGEGTGLGLAVVHGIVDSHDGAISVYSQPGEGTVFHLYFPAHAGETVVAPVKEESVPRGRGERVLFVDDEELLIRLGQKILAALGYEVEVATRPAAALAMVRADPQRFALVISDQTMPGMTGLVFATELMKIRPDLPIILMTGYSLSLTSDRVKAAGVRELLLKPISIRSLGTAVHEAISTQVPR